MIRRSENELSILWASTDEMYQGGGLYSRAVTDYLAGNPGVTRITSSVYEPNTLRAIEEAAQRGEDAAAAFQHSLIGRVRANWGFPNVESIQILRDTSGEPFVKVISGR